MISYGDGIVDQGKMTASRVTEKQKRERPGKLYRVMIRGQEYLGTAEEYQANVVAPDSPAAVCLTIEALKLDPASVQGVVVTLMRENGELPEGEVFAVSHRYRGFGERGGWVPDSPPARRP